MLMRCFGAGGIAFNLQLLCMRECIRGDEMDIFEIAELLTAHGRAGERYHEFLRADTLSIGLYVLPTGDLDPQQPHSEDEIYYVVEGSSRIRIGDEDGAVKAGDVIFVGAGVEHRFYDIVETLRLLVVFAPPRGSQA